MILWIIFTCLIIIMLALDLGLFNKNPHEIKIKEALLWSTAWICLALIFNLGLYFYLGSERALEFLTGYVIEKSLSIDNLFVFWVIFSYFQTPKKYQHKVLFWGILGALFMRALIISTGIALISNFHWMIYLFGGLLIFTAIRLLKQKEASIDLKSNTILTFIERNIRFTSYREDKFFWYKGGCWWATRLFMVLLAIEISDLIFAIDSIPAIFAVTQDPFIIYSSNIFAILGLRSLYFALSGVINKFHFLKTGLSVILGFVGVKMLISDIYVVPIGLSLGAICLILMISIGASLKFPPQIRS